MQISFGATPASTSGDAPVFSPNTPLVRPPPPKSPVGPVALVAIAIGVVAVLLTFARTSARSLSSDDADDPPETTSSTTVDDPVPTTTAAAPDPSAVPMLNITAQPIGRHERPVDPDILRALDAGLAALAQTSAHSTTRSAKAPDEGGAIDAARAALDKGDATKALVLLDAYDHDFKSGGLLGIEARVLRIEALTKKGDDAVAYQRAGEFLDDYPHSPKAGRVKAIFDALHTKHPDLVYTTPQ